MNVSAPPFCFGMKHTCTEPCTSYDILTVSAIDKIELHNEEFTYSTKCISQTITLFKLEKRLRDSISL